MRKKAYRSSGSYVRIKKSEAPWCDSDECDSEEDEYDPNHPDWNLLRGCELHIFAGRAGRKRLVRVHTTNDDNVYHYKGPKGKERLVRHRANSCRSDKFFEGTKGQERMVRMSWDPAPDKSWSGRDEVQYFKGGQGEEYLVRKYDRRYKSTKHYVGSRGQERKARTEHSNGQVDHYDVSFEFKPAVLTRTEYPNGSVDVFDGIWDNHPHRVRHIHPSGQVDHFGHGPFLDCDFTERTEWPDGTITHFQFLHNEFEHLPLVTELPSGQVCYHGTLLQKMRAVAAGCHEDSKWVTRVELRNGRVLSDASFRWVKVRRWVTKRVIALYWQERTQMRLAAHDGAGRRADLAAYEADFGA